jgi:hypothetical protein
MWVLWTKALSKTTAGGKNNCFVNSESMNTCFVDEGGNQILIIVECGK